MRKVEIKVEERFANVTLVPTHEIPPVISTVSGECGPKKYGLFLKAKKKYAEMRWRFRDETPRPKFGFKSRPDKLGWQVFTAEERGTSVVVMAPERVVADGAGVGRGAKNRSADAL